MPTREAWVIPWGTHVSDSTPPRLTDRLYSCVVFTNVWAAASPPQSQAFMLVGSLLIIPMILGYTFWSYYVFRGKIKADEGYH